MKVAYDISVLGNVHFWGHGATGVPRVVEAVLRGLSAAADCEVLPCATLRAHRASEYARINPLLAGRTLLNHRADGTPGYVARRLDRWALRQSGGLGRLGGLAGSILLLAANGFLSAIDRRALAGVDIFHSPFDPLPQVTRGIPGLQRFLTIHDLVPVLHPNHLQLRHRLVAQMILRGIKPDDWVICNSETTKRDFCGHTGFDPARVFVTPLAADLQVFHPCADAERQQAVRQRLGIPLESRYLLSLGTLEPRKNLRLLVRAFDRLSREPGMEPLYLVLVGGRGWKRAGGLADELARLGPLRERVILTGFVPDEDLSPLYSGALAFIYMSLYEGFGLPPLEAMQCGVPVVVSNVSALPEVVGDAGIQLDPNDVAGLASVLAELVCDPVRRNALSVHSLARAHEFSWERCVNQTLAAYQIARKS